MKSFYKKSICSMILLSCSTSNLSAMLSRSRNLYNIARSVKPIRSSRSFTTSSNAEKKSRWAYNLGLAGITTLAIGYEHKLHKQRMKVLEAQHKERLAKLDTQYMKEPTEEERLQKLEMQKTEFYKKIKESEVAGKSLSLTQQIMAWGDFSSEPVLMRKKNSKDDSVSDISESNLIFCGEKDNIINEEALNKYRNDSYVNVKELFKVHWIEKDKYGFTKADYKQADFIVVYDHDYTKDEVKVDRKHLGCILLKGLLVEDGSYIDKCHPLLRIEVKEYIKPSDNSTGEFKHIGSLAEVRVKGKNSYDYGYKINNTIYIIDKDIENWILLLDQGIEKDYPFYGFIR